MVTRSYVVVTIFSPKQSYGFSPVMFTNSRASQFLREKIVLQNFTKIGI